MHGNEHTVLLNETIQNIRFNPVSMFTAPEADVGQTGQGLDYKSGWDKTF